MKQRIPKDFFITKGIGESNNTHHAGSYHLALDMAGIETQNIMTYSSILPPEANEISQPNDLHFGAVMECIMSCVHGKKGEVLGAGIAYAWLYDENKKRIGGLVVERSGNYTKGQLCDVLLESLIELKTQSFDKYDMSNEEYILESFIPNKEYGTALVSMCFLNYV